MSTPELKLFEGESTRPLWEEIWDQDSWRQHEVPNGDLSSAYRGNRIINFSRISQPWLKESCKRFSKSRLMTGTAVQSVISYVHDVAAFSEWLATEHAAVDSPARLNREILEDYLAFVAMSDTKPATKSRHAASVKNLIEEQREDGLRGIPASAKILPREIHWRGKTEYALPKKQIDDTVFEQLVDAKNLSLIPLRHRTLILVLADTGMRLSSVLSLKRDALTYDHGGAPYLKYTNVKYGREAAIPVSDRLRNQLKAHESWLKTKKPHSEYMFPGMNHSQTEHISHSTARRALKKYIEKADIRDSDGELADFAHPHLFRHHMGTSLVNEGVPLHVIAEVLDHSSLEMTAHYAKIHDGTLRTAMEEHHKRVNARGEYVALPSSGPLSDAHWKKERIARAKQALPNGYCGLPLIQTCPHPNACLSCDNFLTDATFLDVHLEHRERTMKLREEHSRAGRDRLVEVHDSELSAIDRILEGLQAIEVEPSETAHDKIDLRMGLDRE